MNLIIFSSIGWKSDTGLPGLKSRHRLDCLPFYRLQGSIYFLDQLNCWQNSVLFGCRTEVPVSLQDVKGRLSPASRGSLLLAHGPLFPASKPAIVICVTLLLQISPFFFCPISDSSWEVFLDFKAFYSQIIQDNLLILGSQSSSHLSNPIMY